MEKNNYKIYEMRRKLINWSNCNLKDYPWRNSSNSYEVIISEILLHKTDSKKVKNLYPKFIKRFPTIQHISHADLEDIDDIIKEIGLYYRTIRIKRIAEQIINNFGGNVPDKKEDLMSLYGVGEYISNAVLCFAFKKRVPIVDTNVIRVYGRIFDLKSSKSRPHTDKEIWNFAEKILPEKDYVKFNYALLDFASEICRAKKPSCDVCPIKSDCAYNNCGDKFHES